MVGYFGAIFPCSAEHRESYEREAPELAGRPVLDVGFGTGEHLAWLAERGAVIHGLEASEEQVAWAKRRFPRFADNFCVGSMSSVSRAFEPRRFALTLLVGNTLAHATDQSDAERAVAEMARLTADDGVCILSVVNYDRILGQGVTTLPTIRGATPDGRAFAFFRSYDLGASPGKVRFETRLECPDGVVEGRHELLPIRRADLEAMTRAAFDDVSVFGGYLREPWTEETFTTALVARSPGRSGTSEKD